MFNLARGAFLTRTMVRKSKNIGSGSKSGQSWDFLISWIFGIPIFRTLFEKIDPPWPLRANHYVEKNPIWILSMLGFRHKLSKVFVFTNQIPLFHENPVSSVRPSEASSGRFLCFHPDSWQYIGNILGHI